MKYHYRQKLRRDPLKSEVGTVDEYIESLRKRLQMLEEYRTRDQIMLEMSSTHVIATTNSMEVAKEYKLLRQPVQLELTAEQLRAARAWLGMTQQELADRAGIKSSTIHMFETGHTMAIKSIAAVRNVLESMGIRFTSDSEGNPVGIRKV